MDENVPTLCIKVRERKITRLVFRIRVCYELLKKCKIEKVVTNYRVVLRIVGVSLKRTVRLWYKIKYVEKVGKDSRLVRAVFKLT